MTIKIDERARGFIFDIDGTLANTMPIHYQAWCEIAGRYGFDMTEALLYRLAGMPTGEIVKYINQHQGYNLEVEKITKVKNETYLRLATSVQLIGPVFKIVEQYYQKMPMALGTGEYRDIAMMNIKATGLDKYFDIIVTADDVKNSKPDPETFLKCAEFIGVSPEYCQVFEDAEPGLEAGRKAGMIVTDVRPFLRKDMIA